MKKQLLFAPGDVALVGAGPGDAELLTFKALRYISQADVIFYDRLVSDEVLALVPDSIEKIFVGKQVGNHCISQEAIISLLLERAQVKQRVVRLKGGDPFVFGRGGEEMTTLQEQQVTVHVVPGITAALGCAASAGIALTHRDFAKRVTFMTAHPCAEGELNWHALSEPDQTLVFYMGVRQAPTIQRQLLSEGMSETMPVVFIERGTHSDERVVKGSLKELTDLAETVHSPALLIVGQVVNTSA
ncbi:uroporphyrinogen-III C-methyltransferase [Celerinatantimonas diazotrophica]|uniref:uroporphyrinogen-III C-methyltransferase n=1 Tax=Celerinatantimonas diazotrophica TaxID=412034 RepID=A0A4R1J8N7_9GAMM|nr:uroporphyrinogen-III C-methyltransferase [Celerinatantimonas diazotrophica]TCK46938.1 uroporphyrin-III C-methyltransferase/precorrin-2 dehydrogenase/sirohydrochlorin ferrochelatase [Celerinatantimonas diazotrophica]CAG9295706.1 Siroheme synthase [Celerinatantimonas diazotrophica]